MILAIINLLMVLETEIGDWFYDIFYEIGWSIGEFIVWIVDILTSLF